MQNLFRATNHAINAGVVEATQRERRRFWSAWTTWLAHNFPHIHPKMHTIVRPDQITLLVAFAHHVRSGGVSTRSREVRAQTVQVALRSIGTKFLLDGEPSPLGPPKGGYPKALQQLLEGYRREDPVSQPKLAIPLTVPRYLHLQGNTFGSEKEKAIGDFALIAFYYLLRVGEYTYHRPSDRRRTQQFRAHDVAFWQDTTLLPHGLPLEHLLKARTSATLSIFNQKNGKRNQSIHQEAINGDTCPVKALIRRIKHIRAHTYKRDTVLGT